MDYVLEGLLLYPSEFFLHLKTSFSICLNFQRVIFSVWIYSTSNEQRIDLRCSRNSLPVHWNRMLSNSSSQQAVQRQQPLNCIRCWWSWTTKIGAWIVCLQNRSRSGASTTTFKDELELEVFPILDKESLCKILKIYDNECRKFNFNFEFRNG